MCEAFVENGATVDLVVNKRKIDQGASVETLLGFVPRFTIHRIRPIFFILESKAVFLINDALFAIALAIFYKPKTYDAVYVRDEWLLYFVSFFVPTRLLVYESHEAKYNYAARTLLQKGVRCVCISEGIAEEYQDRGIPAGQLMVAHDGVDDSFFDVTVSKSEAREALGLKTEKKIAMYIGGFEKLKGVELFFEASNRTPVFLFVAIGGKEEQIAAYREKYPNVTFLGFQPYKNLKNNQQAADVLVVPNSAEHDASSKHTSPLKLFTYMSSGVPILSASVPSLQTVLTDEMGYFFKPDSAESLVETLEKIAKDTANAPKKAQNAQKVARDYTWRKRAENILRFIGRHEAPEESVVV